MLVSIKKNSSKLVCVERSGSHLGLVRGFAVGHGETKAVEVGLLVWARLGCAARLGDTYFLTNAPPRLLPQTSQAFQISQTCRDCTRVKEGALEGPGQLGHL